MFPYKYYIPTYDMSYQQLALNGINNLHCNNIEIIISYK